MAEAKRWASSIHGGFLSIQSALHRWPAQLVADLHPYVDFLFHSSTAYRNLADRNRYCGLHR